MLHRLFKPEFLNRIDDTIIFGALTREDLAQIVELQVAGLNALVEDRGLTIEVTDAAKRHLAEAGYDPAFGARPLRRAIQRLVQDPLALALLQGEFTEGDRVRVDVRDGAIALTRAAGNGATAEEPEAEAQIG